MGGGHRFDFFMSLSPTNDMYANITPLHTQVVSVLYCFTGKKQ